VLPRLACLAVTNTFTLLRLLPMSDHDKDIEILALRHQLPVLQRQVGKPAFTDTDRVVLAGLRSPGPAPRWWAADRLACRHFTAMVQRFLARPEAWWDETLTVVRPVFGNAECHDLTYTTVCTAVAP
jgi:hypothetical protein